jgi:hypothetical protein
MAPSHKQWIIPFAVQLIPAGCLLLGAFWMRESPRWCLSKGKREQALKDLCWIRNLPQDHPYILEELEAIDAQVEHDRITVGPGFWKPFAALKQRKVQYRIFLGGMLFLWQNGKDSNVRIACETYTDLPRLRNQRHQLLLTDGFQESGCNGRLPHNGYFRRREMCAYICVAHLANRSPRPHETPHVRSLGRFPLHVVHCCVHQDRRPCGQPESIR